MLTLADKGGRVVRQILTLADKRGSVTQILTLAVRREGDWGVRVFLKSLIKKLKGANIGFCYTYFGILINMAKGTEEEEAYCLDSKTNETEN